MRLRQLCHAGWTKPKASKSAALLEGGDDAVGVVDTASPSAAGGGLQSGPQPRVVGQTGVRGKVRSRNTLSQHAGALFRREGSAVRADEVDAAFESVAVDN